jgi:ElaB/YqjD/DUF883 family membrane-anchored ribosome-binding protein
MDNTMKKDGNMLLEADRNTKIDYPRAAEKITDAAKEAKFSAMTTMKSIQDYCRENPGKAIGIAAGVGAVVGLALMKTFGRKESASEEMFSRLFRKAEKAWNQVKSGVKPAVKNIRESLEG